MTEPDAALYQQLGAEIEARYLTPLDVLLGAGESLAALRRRLDTDA